MKINATGFKIKNFRSIENLQVDFKANANLLENDIEFGRMIKPTNYKYGIPTAIYIFGRNAIGKSSILDAIGYIQFVFLDSNVAISEAIVSKKLEEFWSNPSNQAIDAKERFFITNNLANEIFEKIKVRDPEIMKNYYYNAAKEIFQYFYEDNVGNAESKEPIEITLMIVADGKDDSLTITTKSDGGIDIIWPKHMNKDNELEYKTYFSKIIIDNGHYRFNKSGNSIAKSRFNFNKDSKEISHLIYQLSKVISRQKIDDLIKLADPNVEKIDWQKANKDAKFEIPRKIISRNGSFDFAHLSSGTINFLNLARKILEPALPNTENEKKSEGHLILIDEIELSLHNELINVIKALMIEVSKKFNAQFIVTSHSPMIMESFVSYKQCFSMEFNDKDELELVRLSSIMKPKQSAINNYQKGIIAPYPNVELAMKVVGSLFHE